MPVRMHQKKSCGGNQSLGGAVHGVDWFHWLVVVDDDRPPPISGDDAGLSPITVQSTHALSLLKEQRFTGAKAGGILIM